MFILGAAKCGTTSLAEWMRGHPQVCVSDEKEPRFFTTEYWRGAKWYLDTYFPHLEHDDQVRVDARPMNLIVDYVADRINEMCSSPKFIVLVRDPIERAYSSWMNYKTMRPGREPHCFAAAIGRNLRTLSLPIFRSEEEYILNVDPRGGTYRDTYLEAGFYSHHINRYTRLFGVDSVLVMTLDSMISNPDLVWDDSCTHFGVSPNAYKPEFVPHNQARVPTARLNLIERIGTELYVELMELYRPSVLDLSMILNRDLEKEWWG